MLFNDTTQYQDWKQLQDAIVEADDILACQSDPDLFFPEQGHREWATTIIKDVCNDCPIQRQCADYGIKWEAHGYWGGLGQRERATLRKRRNLPPLETMAPKKYEA